MIDTGDGKIDFVETDTGNTQSWTTRTTTIDWLNETAQVNTLFDNLWKAKTQYDIQGNQPWTSRTLTEDINGYLKSQADVLDSLDRYIRHFDTQNTHPYGELDVSTDRTGQLTAAQAQLDANIIAAGGSIGQIFGSALGRALAPNNQFAQLAVGTVAGLIGQKLLQTFTASLTLDASRFIAGNFGSVTGLDVTNAGLGAISSFLTAELGRGLQLTGFGAELFNGAVGGVTGSVLSQVATKVAAGYSFDAAIGFINWSTAATQAGYNISGAVGSFLAHQFVHAESHEGAVGGQLFGALGSALGLSAAINATLTGVLGFLIPGLGSFFGTIIGTMLGDALAGDPAYPTSVHDVRILGADLHFTNRLFGTDNNGNADISQAMGDQVTAIANSYLDAVHAAGVAYSGKVMIGYNAGAAPYSYITGWFPNGTGPVDHFAQATDAIQQGVRELLVNTEVIGGDLLIKRAHQAFVNGPHPAPTEISPDFSDLIKLGGDLSVAQDYENYLNNREAINALIAANPDTAFAAGWIATFARVNDLGLNHVNGSDFFGGLVGYLDSVSKAGLGSLAANATVKLSGSNVTVDVKVANSANVPGSLSVFADQVSQTSDATGTTVQFTFANGLAAGGFHLFAPGQTSGDTGNDLWFGGNVLNYFDASASANAILVGGASYDVLTGGNGWDFIDGGAHNDTLSGGKGGDILRGGPGADALYGGAGNDTYVFNRGDGADWVQDEYRYMELDSTGSNGPPGSGSGSSHEVHADGGADTLVFGPDIRASDITVYFGGAAGTDLIVDVRDPAHPGATPTDVVTLLGWGDWADRIETFAFADGTTLDMSGQFNTYRVPFGASFSGKAVAENSPLGTPVGTVAGFDLLYGAALTYSLADNAGGRFAINALTGVITVAAAIDYEATTSHAHEIKVRIADQYGHIFDKPFTIAVTDAAPIVGSSGNDHLTGTALTDIIDGGAGNDVLTGGAGSDRFIYRPGSGADIITDFAAGAGSDDKLDLSAFANSYTLTYVLAHTTQSGANTVIDLGGGDTITLQNVAKASLSGSDFVGMQAFTYGGIWTPAGNGSDNTWHIGDFNGDGKDDIFRYLASSGEQVFVSTGSGFAYSGVWSPAGNGSDNTWHIGDFNGDGKDDMFRYIDGLGEQMFLSSGSSFFYNGVWSPAGAGIDGTWHVGDFNGDGKDDVFRYLNGEDVFLSNGSGFVHSGVWSPAGNGSDGKWYIGDFNGDAKDDIFRYMEGTGVQMFLSNGSSFVYNGVWSPAGAGFDGTFHVGDFNGDGKDDLFRYMENQSGSDVFLSNGSSFVYDTVWTGAGIGVDNQWYVGDFNGGGADDVFRYLSGVGLFPSAFG